ncbi:TlpA family protein disulfide reductase [Fretibacter rubidus]|uniref:TlpA family protein disulfide reductase n=1 Tax=Fretibacter rubidus TaxID=570162 RepID=UPI00352B708F
MSYKSIAATLFTIALGASLTACSGADKPNKTTASDTTQSAQSTDIKAKAVLIYADWCGSCKVLDPKIKAARDMARDMGDVPALDFVTLDYTDKDVDAFYAQAKAAGVEDAVRAHLDGTIKTGLLLMVDLDDQAVLDVITKAQDAQQILFAMKDAAARS